jgi:hypothetical protein
MKGFELSVDTDFTKDDADRKMDKMQRFKCVKMTKPEEPEKPHIDCIGGMYPSADGTRCVCAKGMVLDDNTG